MATAAKINLTSPDSDLACINSIRVLAIDAVQKANSGHPGMPMGMAPVGYLLFTRYMRHSPKNPAWYGRDRFVLSAGHGSMLLYSLLYLTGYDMTMEDIENFRQLGSRTPGHPENYLTPGVETTTGPLGQGFGNGVGMAIAAAHLENRFERDKSGLFDHRIFGICGDGDLMEGISSEAASIAGHLGLGNIIYIYDDNNVTIDGHTELTFDEDVCRRFDAYGWHTQHVEDANDLTAISKAIEAGIAETKRPSLIRVRSIIGYGSPHRQGTSEAHGKALGVEEVKLTKQFYGWPLEPAFYVPDEALAKFRTCVGRGAQLESEWNGKFDIYAKQHPAEAAEFKGMLAKELPKGWDAELPVFTPADKLATRESASKAEAAITAKVWNLFGGAADLNESTFTDVKGGGDFERGEYGGRNLHFGIREHGMCAILNGIALHGGFIPYGSSFLCFTDYCRPSIRLAALMQLHVVFVFTHDSIGLGEDGPTHQPVEHLAALRAIPHLTVIRPGDANEAVEAWRTSMTHTHGPVMLVLSRQKMPTLDRTKFAPAAGARRGGYVLGETAGKTPEIILMSTGSELSLIVDAKAKLEEKGKAVRVVSMPSMEIFEQQDQAYRDVVLPPNIRRRLAVEAAVAMSWYQWVGPEGDIIGMTTFGASGKYEDLEKHFGFTVENVVDRALKVLAR
ncbi:MAG: transketolase [Candidatus Binatus sp.]|uniref:transketolase n=1 Tax=Candidatus Binatus sp. TaxID=2811406 RepID=UPI002720E173|nr:transketolase [Candidatus Binatus sp.]MDO8433888.1 transketolase [Candidatus Binatus sp.]